MRGDNIIKERNLLDEKDTMTMPVADDKIDEQINELEIDDSDSVSLSSSQESMTETGSQVSSKKSLQVQENIKRTPRLTLTKFDKDKPLVIRNS